MYLYFQTVLNEPVIKVTEGKDVRWLSHDKAVRAVRQTLPAIVTSLEYEANMKSDAQAEGLVFFIQDYRFVATLYMLSDVLPIFALLSRAFQV